MFIKYDYSSQTNSLFDIQFPIFNLSEELSEYVQFIEIYDHTLIIKMHEFLKDPSNTINYTYKTIDGKVVKKEHKVPTLNKIKEVLFKKHKDPIILKIYDRIGTITNIWYFTKPNIKLYPTNNIILNVFYSKLQIII